MRSTSSVLLLLQCLAYVNGRPAAEQTDLTVKLEDGRYKGELFKIPENGQAARRFRGIRYAAPVQRFQPAQPAEKFDDVKNATGWGSACIEQLNCIFHPIENKIFFKQLYNAVGDIAPQSEDCLFLNVFAPNTKKTGLPVMFWIHGGSLEFGTASSPQYDGSRIAANQEVIVVTINYRTNVFGFPISPEVPVMQRNLGLLDQRYVSAALTWVQNNIKAFGGDPSKVTIFGESAGSGSVDMLVVTNPKPLPFRASISQSGTAQIAGRLTGPMGDETGYTFFSQLAIGLGCDNSTKAKEYECVKAAPAANITAVLEGFAGLVSFQPIADNVTAVADYASRRRTGNVAPVPGIIGNNNNEGTVVLATSSRGWNLSYAVSVFSGASAVGQASAATLSRIAATYDDGIKAAKTSAEIEEANYWAIDRYFTDFSFQCPTATQTKLQADAGYPSWRYYYNVTFPNTDLYNRSGVYHFSEIFAIFGNFPIKDAYNRPAAPVSDQQRQFSAKIQKVWVDFAKHPSNPGWRGISEGFVGLIEVDGIKEMTAASLDGNRCQILAETS